MTISAATSALSACAAVLIAPNETDTANLKLVATAAEFGAALDFRMPTGPGADLMPFYLLHHSVPDAAKARFIKTIRHSDEPRKKFAPIVLFLPKGPAHQSVFYVEMGFDDVFFMSDDIKTIHERLLLQIGHEVMFVQTGNYLGPDRRRMERIRKDDPRRKFGGSVHRRFAVFRDPVHGFKVEDRP